MKTMIDTKDVIICKNDSTMCSGYSIIYYYNEFIELKVMILSTEVLERDFNVLNEKQVLKKIIINANEKEFNKATFFMLNGGLI